MKKNFMFIIVSRLLGCKSKLLLVMRLSIILMLTALIQIQATAVYSQKAKISLQMSNTAIEKILNEIETKTDYFFLYNNKLVDVKKRVSVEVENKSVKDVLDKVFTGTDTEYLVMNKQIVLTPAKLNSNDNDRFILPEDKVVTGVNVMAQSSKITITGKVSDTNGETLPGVNVMEKGKSTNGVVTDAYGKYTISVSEGATLLFSFVGMKNKEVSIGSQKVVNVVLESEMSALNEVVVVGYGTQKKTTLTGSVSNMKAEKLESIPASNLSNVLAGRMAGLQITQTTGTPGVSAQIKIRATASWNNSSPIFVIDGIVRDKEAFDNLDPNEVEEISILKDAAAAAVYGSRSANGAVLVTTKKGKSGAPTISYSASYSYEKPTMLPDVMDNAYEINKFFNRVIDNKTNHWAYWSEEELEWLKKQNGGKGWNWFDEASQDPNNQRHAINVSGGTEKVRYFISGSFFDQNGIVKNLGYKKYNLRGKVDVDVHKNLTVGLQLANIYTNRKKYNFQYDYGNDALPDVFSKLYLYNWDVPPYVDGKPIDNGWVGHPIELISNSGYWRRESSNQEAIITANFKVPYVKGLNMGLSFAKNIRSSVVKSFWRKAPYYRFKRTGPNNKIVTNEIIGTGMSNSPGRESLTNSNSKSDDYQLNFNINYKRTFGDHTVNALFVYEQVEGEYSYFYGTRYDFPLIVKDQWFATSSAEKDSRVNGYESEHGRLSYIGRLNYDYKEKYLLSASIRRDGSMKFAPSKRWGWFPSVSAGWRVSEEDFFKDNITFIDYLKLRGSYGILGDDATSSWQWQETYSATGGFLFGDNNNIGPKAGAKYDGISNPDITWEKSKSINLGIDAKFLDNKLELVADFWKRSNYDILRSRIASLPASFGANMPHQNYAEIDSEGFEIELNYNDKIGDFKYNAGINFSYATNEVKKIDVAENTPDYKNPIGRSMDYIYTVKYKGMIRTQADLDALPEGYRIFGYEPKLGMLDYEDISGADGKPDGKIDGYDNQVVADHSVPPYNLGFRLGGEWKGLSIDMFFHSAFGHKKWFNGVGRESFPGIRPMKFWATDSWTPENTDAKYPKAVDWHVHPGYKSSTFWLYDGAYMRLKNLNIAYRIPENITKKYMGISNMRIYFNATNLFTISKFTKEGFYDPELTTSTHYPNMKTYTFGLNITL